MILIMQRDKFAKNERAKSDEFALLVGDLVYIHSGVARVPFAPGQKIFFAPPVNKNCRI